MTLFEIYLVAHGTCAGFIAGRMTAYIDLFESDDWWLMLLHIVIAPLSVAIACAMLACGFFGDWRDERRLRKKREAKEAETARLTT